MAQIKFGAAGVSATEIDLSGPVAQQPVGVPAGVIGTAARGPAFVPITVGLTSDFYAKFGPTDGVKFGPIAATEWLRNAQALTYMRVLGIGDGNQRSTQTGDVTAGGFTVGERQPDPDNAGTLSNNPYAVVGGAPGRTYFIGCFMSESAGSTVLSSAGVQSGSNAQPVIRGVLMAASGVVLTLSSSTVSSVKPAATATSTDSNGSSVGSVTLLDGGLVKQDFVMLLNGHKGLDNMYPNVITASFDVTSPNYLSNVMNVDPTKLQQAGHLLYAYWDMYPATAVVTGSGIISASLGAGAVTATVTGAEPVAFILSGSTLRDVGSDTAPNFEDFRDRFTHAASPWVTSQPFGGRPQNLFRVHALDAGAGVSTMYKLAIENIAPSTDPTNQYPTFDLAIRTWYDNDATPSYIEQWRGLSLNPSDDRYIAKVIGDQHAYYDFDRGPTAQKLVVEGNYGNSSNVIRVEVDPGVDSGDVDPTAMPVGLRGPSHLMTAGTSPLARPAAAAWIVDGSTWTRVKQPPVPFRQNITQGSGEKLQVNPLLYWGVQFEHVTSLLTPNLSTLRNVSIESTVKHFPSHRTDVERFCTVHNAGESTTTANGVVDNDLFNSNAFSLMNVRVTTGSSGIADPNEWASAAYVRDGNIVADDAAKTRALSTSDFTQANRRFLKWNFFMQGGFDGTNVFDADEAALTNAAVTADMDDPTRGSNNGPAVAAYTKALQIMGEQSVTDLQMLVIPGVRHPVVTDAAVSAVESRFDALYLMDIEQYDSNDVLVTSDDQKPSVALTTQNFTQRSLNTSFAAAYFPDVVMIDPSTGTNVIAPPSVAVLGAIALNDKVGHPWFAPAGFTRGALQSTLEARVQLSKPNMDVLYDAGINPLVAFPGNASGGLNPNGGVVVWGQKTLQQAASALDRVNVRRLLIEIRRQVRDVALGIVFEPNREATLARFSAAITPRLQKIQAQAGLERFSVVVDSSTTSAQDIENNTLRGKIYVQPTKSIEFVSLDFVVSNNGQQIP